MGDFISIYDTTLRDGAQTDGIDFSVADKRYFTGLLDTLHFDMIEGGWCGANPTDTTFFETLPPTQFSKIATFGMTRRGKIDKIFDAWTKTPVDVFTLVGKTWDFHVEQALKISLEDNLKNIYDSIYPLAKAGKTVLFDAEHYFDGFKHNKTYALKAIKQAYKAGARWIVLCDTNGGCLPFEIEEIVTQTLKAVPGENLSIHCHNDTGNAVANTLAAVRAGVRQVQGTINGLGERCGNADLTTVIPDLVFKMGYKTSLSPEHLKGLTGLSRALYEKLNKVPPVNQPYVGPSAFTHKGGLHVSAINKNPKSYEHITPETVGNKRRILVSGQSGKSNITAQLKQIGIELPASDPRLADLLMLVKEKESLGFSYDGCEASFEVLARAFLFGLPPLFTLEAFRVIDERRHNSKGVLEMMSDATVQVFIRGKKYIEADTGNGPVDALTHALLKVLSPVYPVLKDFKLADYRVRIFNSNQGTGASTRVMIDTVNEEGKRWSTVGISTDIIDASFQAIYDSILYRYYCL